ncbi:MAG: acetate--CoA ligase family protein [Candidatus Hodarchaeota archaeon]
MSHSTLDALFHPKSIAVIGASAKSGRIGRQVVESLIKGGFRGEIYPINPKLKTLLGLQVFPSIEAVSKTVDCAIIVLKKDQVLNAIDRCGKSGVKSVIVMSSGFSELGDESTERELVRRVHEYDMRMLGPNCAGFALTHERIYASFENRLLEGHMAFISQSGAMCAVILGLARAVGLGLSIFISYGNAADVGPEDILEYLHTHKPTQLIGGYIEGITQARTFLQIAKKIVPHKPMIILKPGNTPDGVQAIHSHTGQLAGTKAVYAGAFRQAGVLQVKTLDEFIDVCQVLSTQPLPQGNRVGIITNSGGPGVLAVDACARAGLATAPFPPSLVREFEAVLPPFCPMGNPVDLGPEGHPQTYQQVTELLLAENSIDMGLVLCVPTVFSSIRAISQSIAKAKQNNPEKPLVTCWLAEDIVAEGLPVLRQAKIPNFPTPQRAATALAFLYRRAEWLRFH